MRVTFSLLNLIAAGLLLTGCNEADIFESPPDVASAQTSADASTINYGVTRQMLSKFLNTAHKSARVRSIIPICEGGDTLAYCVNLDKGWKLISGDQRMPPVLAFSDEGVLNLLDVENPAIQSIQGLIDRVAAMRASGETHRDPVWALIDTNRQGLEKGASKAKRRSAYGDGMWIATDSAYVSNTDEIPHIIKTSWNQNSPYNNYTVMRQDSAGSWRHCPAGCIPVACGQIIAHYRASNNLGTTLPSAAHMPTINDNWFGVTGFSTDGWSSIFSSSNTQAMFIAYLGSILGTRYSWNAGSTAEGKESKAFSPYKLSFSKSDNYDFTTVMSNLRSGSPVYVVGKMVDNNGASDGKHAFIIDGARTNEDKMVINYEWDESHRITEEEYNRYPSWMFMQSASGDTEMQIERDGIKYTYLRMNWGWGQSYNNTYYLAYSYHAGGSDFAGAYDAVECTYEPTWGVTLSKNNTTSVEKIRYLLYGFKSTN